MPIWDRDLQIKKWDPRILLHSGRNSFLGWLGTKYNAIALNGVAFSNVKTVKIIVGVFGKAGCDFNFTAPVNTTAQNLDLGSIIPAFARVLETKVVCEESPTGLVSMALVAGNASAGAQFMASVQCFTLSTVVATLVALLWTVAPTAAASKVWLQGTPGANWSLDTTNVGKWSVYVTYIDVI
jgi:hypothetical protein